LGEFIPGILGLLLLFFGKKNQGGTLTKIFTPGLRDFRLFKPGVIFKGGTGTYRKMMRIFTKPFFLSFCFFGQLWIP